jgi:hypothetical protein
MSNTGRICKNQVSTVTNSRKITNYSVIRLLCRFDSCAVPDAVFGSPGSALIHVFIVAVECPDFTSPLRQLHGPGSRASSKLLVGHDLRELQKKQIASSPCRRPPEGGP